MKRFISILLVAVMLVAMIPAGIFTVSAAEATLPTQTWIDAGKYDISWVEAFKVNAESSGYTVKIGDNIYKLRGNGKTVTIDSVEKLVGIAYLSNYAKIETFDGCTFKLTLSEYDLSS